MGSAYLVRIRRAKFGRKGMNNLSGFILESLKKTDYLFEKVFKVEKQDIKHLGRSYKDVPIVYQGDKPICVPCSLAWFSMWSGAEKRDPGDLLSNISLYMLGTKPSEALKSAKKRGWIKNYSYIRKRTPDALYAALKLSPLLIGVPSIPTVRGPHAMILLDVDEKGNWVCVSWGTKDKQQLIGLSQDYPISFAVSFAEVPSQTTIANIIPSLLDLIVSFFYATYQRIFEKIIRK